MINDSTLSHGWKKLEYLRLCKKKEDAVQQSHTDQKSKSMLFPKTLETDSDLLTGKIQMF